ncbi:MAG: DNA repair protein RadA [Clostridia bacterium]|nr:DNA repair protein RadA [Clostridia bacterium]
MAKFKSKFICRECGYETVKWMGKCPSCLMFDSFDEEVYSTEKVFENAVVIRPVTLQSIEDDNKQRIDVNMDELNRVLGGGLVKGSMVLVGGDPGIGKSTLLLQLCKSIENNYSILYISGEESLSQIGIRARRLGMKNQKLQLACETDLESIGDFIEKTRPDIAIIDSIQTIYSRQMTSVPGSANQIRNATLLLMNIAKKTDTAIFLVGHVTKDGSIAGPKILEHMVDTVLYFEGDRSSSFRILRAVKNRFGSTNEIGVFEMSDNGLEQIKNPSLRLLSGRNDGAYGSCVMPTLEGTRPIMVEIQALVCTTAFGMPRRMSTGFDNNRVTMLMAILEKVLSYKIYNCDAYVNVAGGIKINEPACDLAIITSIASSFKNKSVGNEWVIIGEAGLTGEVRAVSFIDKRIKESERLGFKKAIVPAANLNEAKKCSTGIEVFGVDNIKKALALVFE